MHAFRQARLPALPDSPLRATGEREAVLGGEAGYRMEDVEVEGGSRIPRRRTVSHDGVDRYSAGKLHFCRAPQEPWGQAPREPWACSHGARHLCSHGACSHGARHLTSNLITSLVSSGPNVVAQAVAI